MMWGDLSMNRTTVAVLSASVALCMNTAGAGPDWTEVGDAGSFLNTAQTPLGAGRINSIAGTLGGEGEQTDFEDAYIIGVDDPTTFRLDLFNADFDAQLFIFNITLSGGALGLLANDNADEKSVSPVLTAISNDGSNALLDLPGDYLVIVAGAGRNPVSDAGLIFDIQNPTEISGADGPGGLLRHTGWVGQGQVGGYAIDMDSTVFPRIPAPAAAMPLALAGLTATRRRR